MGTSPPSPSHRMVCPIMNCDMLHIASFPVTTAIQLPHCWCCFPPPPPCPPPNRCAIQRRIGGGTHSAAGFLPHTHHRFSSFSPCVSVSMFVHGLHVPVLIRCHFFNTCSPPARPNTLPEAPGSQSGVFLLPQHRPFVGSIPLASCVLCVLCHSIACPVIHSCNYIAVLQPLQGHSPR